MLKLITYRKVITGHIDIARWFNFNKDYEPQAMDYVVIKNATDEFVLTMDKKIFTSQAHKGELKEVSEMAKRVDEPVKAWPLI